MRNNRRLHVQQPANGQRKTDATGTLQAAQPVSGFSTNPGVKKKLFSENGPRKTFFCTPMSLEKGKTGCKVSKSC
jgi:hypothetical protein